MTQHELALRVPEHRRSFARPRLSFADALMMLFDYRFIVAAGIIAGLVVAAAIYFLTPEMFRAESRLLVRYITDTTLLDPGSDGGRLLSPDIRGENIINTEVEILANRASIEAVVDQIGPTNFPGIRADAGVHARAVQQLIENLRIDAPRRSNIIRVQYDAATAEHALAALKSVIDVYLNKHIAVHRSAAAYDFLSKQTDQSRARLSETEEELRQIKAEAGPGLASDLGAAMMQRIHDLRRQLGDSETRLAVAHARVHAVQPYSGADMLLLSRLRATNSMSLAGRSGLRERLAQLEARERELIKVYTEDSLPIQELRAQVNALLDSMSSDAVSTNQLADAASNMWRWPDDAETTALQAQVAVLRNQLDAAVAEALRLEQLKTRMDQLERTRQIQEEHYRNFARSMERARINDALDPAKISNISLVQPATLVAARYRPNVRRNMMMASAGGLGLMLLGIPVYESFTGGRRVRRLQDLASISSTEALLDVPETPAISNQEHALTRRDAPPARHHPLWSHSDALADRLVHLFGGRPPSPCIIGLSACHDGAGVTMLSTTLAASLARLSSRRVLLLNTRSGEHHRHHLLGATSTADGVDMRMNGEGHVVAMEHNVFTLDAVDDPGFVQGRLLRRWPDMMRMIRDGDYAFAVLNLPPVTPVSPTLPLVTHLHSTVLVVQAGRDRLVAVQAALQLLACYRARTTSTVLNRVSHHAPEWLRAAA